jgi:hypothetical protein
MMIWEEIERAPPHLDYKKFGGSMAPNWDVRLRAKLKAHWDATSARRPRRRYSGSSKVFPGRAATSNRKSALHISCILSVWVAFTMEPVVTRP